MLYNPEEYWDYRAKNNPKLKSVGFCGNTLKSRVYWKIHRYIFMRDIIPLIKKLVENNKTLRILELGCGVGRWASLIGKVFKEELEKGEINYRGIDVSREMILQAKELEKSNLEFENIGILKLEEKRDYDLVFSFTVLQHLKRDNQKKAFRKISKITKSGGYFVAFELLENDAKKYANHVFPNKKNKWIEMLKKNEFKIESVIPSLYEFKYPISTNSMIIRIMNKTLQFCECFFSPLAEALYSQVLDEDRATHILIKALKN